MTTALLTRRQFSIVSAATCVGAPRWASAQDDKIASCWGSRRPFTGPAAQLGMQFNQGAKLLF
jgi:branched-chain amino acid transport system substrate-binding protein